MKLRFKNTIFEKINDHPMHFIGLGKLLSEIFDPEITRLSNQRSNRLARLFLMTYGPLNLQ